MLPATKQQLVSLINSLGIPLPSDTKLTEIDLEKRLRDALDGAQYIRKNLPQFKDENSTIDIASLPKYTLNDGAEVKDIIYRMSMNEIKINENSSSLGLPPRGLPGQEIFFDLRMTLGSIASVWDRNHKCIVIQDANEESSLCVRLIDVREPSSKVPMIILLFCHDQYDRPPIIGSSWVQRNSGRGLGVAQIKASQDAQQLLLRLLEINSKRISSSYKPQRHPDERKFTLSFLLTTGPIDPKEIGRFTGGACAVCTTPATAACSACHSVYYCGAAHQKSDWKTHKQTCRSLSHSSWYTFTFVQELNNPLMRSEVGQKVDRVNNKSAVDDTEVEVTEEMLTQVPPNVHGTNIFLVKMQMGGFRTPFGLTRQFIDYYDEERILNVSTCPRDYGEDLRVWEKFDSTLERLGSLDGVKLFVWARRTGDWELSVTLDPLPDQNIPW